MRADTRVQIIAAIVLVLSLGASLVLSSSIAAAGGRAQLTYSDTVQEGDPPEIALGVAMGAFRGLFVNILWIRANQMKEDGRFYESIELSRAITRLQPRFPRVWAFLAWNMAYNISVATNTAEERWRWVNAGIRLLREEGIPRNPNDMHLHRELAWLFLHKVQGMADDANLYYKRRVAEEWTSLLGPPPPRPRIDDPDVGRLREEMSSGSPGGEVTTRDLLREAAVRRRLLQLQGVANAPLTLDAASLRRAYPERLPTEEEAQRLAALVDELVGRLRDEADVKLDYNLLRLFEMRRALELSWVRSSFGVELADSARNRKFDALLDDEKYLPAWQALLPHVRRQVITRDYNMELDRMIRYTRKYGPLDWRHPATHAVYWATRGVELGLARLTPDQFDQTNADRVIVQAFQELFRWGDLYYDMLNDSYVAMLDLDFADQYGQVLQELEARATSFEDTQRGFRLYGLGYRNFLLDVVRVYYRMGDYETANAYFEKFRTYKGHNLNDESYLRELMAMSLDEFVNHELAEQLQVPQVAATEVASSLRDAYLRGLLQGDRKVFEAQIDWAKRVHDYYMRNQNHRTNVFRESRMSQMPPVFADAAAQSFVATLASGIVGVESAGLIWRRAPEGLRQSAYDDLRNAIAGALGSEFDAWFPEPPGMEEHRAKRLEFEQGLDEARKQDLGVEEK